MQSSFRFGRRVKLPSTREISHELRMMMSADRIKNLELELRHMTVASPLAELSIAKPNTRTDAIDV